MKKVEVLIQKKIVGKCYITIEEKNYSRRYFMNGFTIIRCDIVINYYYLMKLLLYIMSPDRITIMYMPEESAGNEIH